MNLCQTPPSLRFVSGTPGRQTEKGEEKERYICTYVFKLGLSWRKYISTKISSGRDRGATKRFGGGGGGGKGTISDSILGEHKTLFLTKSL